MLQGQEWIYEYHLFSKHLIASHIFHYSDHCSRVIGRHIGNMGSMNHLRTLKKWRQRGMKNECGEDRRKALNKEELGWVWWQQGFDHSPASQGEGKVSSFHYPEQCCHIVTSSEQCLKKIAAVMTRGALGLTSKPTRTPACWPKEH